MSQPPRASAYQGHPVLSIGLEAIAQRISPCARMSSPRAVLSVGLSHLGGYGLSAVLLPAMTQRGQRPAELSTELCQADIRSQLQSRLHPRCRTPLSARRVFDGEHSAGKPILLSEEFGGEVTPNRELTGRRLCDSITLSAACRRIIFMFNRRR